MKIAYCIRPEYENGGDGIQIIKTRDYLLKCHPELSIEILTDETKLDDTYSLVHIFNYATSEITSRFFNKAEMLNLPIVSSPVFWDYTYSKQPLPLYFKFNKNFISERYVLLFRWLNNIIAEIPSVQIHNIYGNVSRSFRRDIRNFVNKSRLILPNSREEGEKCCAFAGLPASTTDKIRVVYNGVDLSNVEVMSKDAFFGKYKIPEDYILQVGRIEYLKNHLNLITAMKDSPQIPIVIIGNYNKERPQYYNKIVVEGNKRGNVFFLSGVPHDEIYSFYHYAKVHVLLSMRESPGLVSLEALSQQCPIVVSDDRFGPVDTYFHEQCEIVNPFDKREIKDAVLKSMNKEHRPVDLSMFSWEVVAEQTWKAYKEII